MSVVAMPNYDGAIAVVPSLRKPRMTPAPLPPDQQSYTGRFASRLRELRQKNGLTVPDVVADLQSMGFKATQTSVYNWESGRAVPPLDVFPLLAKALKLRTVRAILPRD